MTAKNEQTKDHKTMNWGHKILLSFILFGALIITLVVVCVQTDFHLVAPDYYQQELNYETRIIQSKNAGDLVIRPELDYQPATRQLTLYFPVEAGQSGLEGEMLFFRPSDASQDFKVGLSLNPQGRQWVDLSHRMKGLWKVKLSWSDGRKEYYLEQKILL